MSQPPTQPYTWTYSEYARFPDDGNRYEVIDGEVLVTPAPSPRHQDILAELTGLLRQYVARHRLGKIIPDIDLLFVSGQFLRPDLLFVPNDARHGVTDRGMELAPGLVIEILSPTSSSIDRVKKPRRYGDFGVPEYWVVDPEERVAWVWRFGAGMKEAERISDRITWQPAGAAEPFTLELSELFRPMWS
jgi:Uma2 family endonuclease